MTIFLPGIHGLQCLIFGRREGCGYFSFFKTIGNEQLLRDQIKNILQELIRDTVRRIIQLADMGFPGEAGGQLGQARENIEIARWLAESEPRISFLASRHTSNCRRKMTALE